MLQIYISFPLFYIEVNISRKRRIYNRGHFLIIAVRMEVIDRFFNGFKKKMATMARSRRVSLIYCCS